MSSVSSPGSKVTHISEPGLRIVAITVRQDFLETLWASPTHRISAPSMDLMTSADDDNALEIHGYMSWNCTVREQVSGVGVSKVLEYAKLVIPVLMG